MTLWCVKYTHSAKIKSFSYVVILTVDSENLEDFIPGVDNIPQRNLVDFHLNSEGEN